MTWSEEDFANQVMDLARTDGAFEPTATYDADGDCIEFIAKPDAFWAERVDNLLTVYHSRENQAIVGSMLKGVKRFIRRILDKAPGFAVTVEDSSVRLEHLFLARMWLDGPTEIEVVSYKKLADLAEEKDISVHELCFS